jgi:hypothetical protein
MIAEPLFLSITPLSAAAAASATQNQPDRPVDQPPRKPDWLLLLVSVLLLLTLLIAWLADIPKLLK